MTTHGASGWMLTSPVISPTLEPSGPPNSSVSSRNFWFESAFRGLV